jgi:hypothetical protein
MMDVVNAIVSSRATLDGLTLLACAFAIFAFAKGWLLTPFQIKDARDTQNARIAESNKRGDEWQTAYDKQTEALTLALTQLDKYKVVGETTNKLLESLPVPPIEVTEGEDNQ